MSVIHGIKRRMLKHHINKLSFPEFHDTGTIRLRLTYTGKVQRVGFRDEMRFIAGRITLTGNVRNSGGDTVIAELQGAPDRLEAIKQAILHEKRFIIEHVEEESLACIPGESEFIIQA